MIKSFPKYLRNVFICCATVVIVSIITTLIFIFKNTWHPHLGIVLGATVILFIALFYFYIFNKGSLQKSPQTSSISQMRRLMSFDSDGLNAYGWYVELDGRRVAILYPGNRPWLNADYSYTIHPLVQNASLIGKILDQEFWDNNVSRICIRSRLTKEIVKIWLHGRFEIESNGLMRISTIRYLGLAEPERSPSDFCKIRKFQGRIKEHRLKIKQ